MPWAYASLAERAVSSGVGWRRRHIEKSDVNQQPDPIEIRLASPADAAAIHELLPSLASFEVPESRNPRHLWEGDAVILQEWADGQRPECFVHVASDAGGVLLGASIVSLREELLSHNPSAHLEVIVVSAAAQRRGVATRLLQAAENTARERGARSMSLHVFANNMNARRLYEKAGYDGELMRYIKSFSGDALS